MLQHIVRAFCVRATSDRPVDSGGYQEKSGDMLKHNLRDVIDMLMNCLHTTFLHVVYL